MSVYGKQTKGFIEIALAVVLFFAIGAGVFFIFQNSNDKPQEKSFLTALKETPTPTPFLFQEMTVPYLRSREYNSELGELEKQSENSNYSSYLTSYDSDELKINGLLTIPKGDKPENGWPAVVFVHGYIPPGEYRTTQNYVSYMDYIAKNGFVVFKIDLRGHDQSEGIPSGAYYSGNYVIDTLNAYSALQSADFVNPDKVGLWGHSMAGNVTFRSFVVKQNIPVLVIWAGAVYTYEDMQEIGISDNSYKPPASDSPVRKEREKLGETWGSFDKTSEFWKQVVPTNYLDGVTGAIEINHAANDPVVSIDYSRNLIDILDNTEITHELKVYPSGGHNIAGDSFTPAMQNTVDFFTKYLSD